MNDKKKERLKADIALFARQYRRKVVRGHDPNDRHYDRKLERRIKQMKAEDFDDLLNQ